MIYLTDCRLKEVDVVLLEAMCMYQVHRTLGFEDADVTAFVARCANPAQALLFERTRDDDMCLFLRLCSEAQPLLKYTSVIGPVQATEHQFARIWVQALDRWNHSLPDERDAVWEQSRAGYYLPGIAAMLKKKGFVLPRDTSVTVAP